MERRNLASDKHSKTDIDAYRFIRHTLCILKLTDPCLYIMIILIYFEGKKLRSVQVYLENSQSQPLLYPLPRAI